MYARIVVIAGSASLYETYIYEIAEDESKRIGIGDCVVVPFSSGRALGYVVELPDGRAVKGNFGVVR